MASIEGWSNKSLGTGSSCPPYTNGKIRIYSMRFCPYAQRALLTCLAKNLPFEVVNINTKNKPEWFAKLNPHQTVPTIQYNDKIVYESLVAAEWLDEAFDGDRKIVPKDPYCKAQQKMLLEQLIKIGMASWNFYSKKDDPAAIAAVADCLTNMEKSLTSDYFGGNEPMYVDYMIWPWLERMAGIAIHSGGILAVVKDKHPKLTGYIDRMSKRDDIKRLFRPGEDHIKFFLTYIAGNPEFDFILPH